jgi:potassium transporter
MTGRDHRAVAKIELRQRALFSHRGPAIASGSILRADERLDRDLSCDIDLSDITYYVGHETITPRGDAAALPRWVEALFALMQRNAAHFTDYFTLPPDAVVEIVCGIDRSLDRLDGLVASARRLDEATADLVAEPRRSIDLPRLLGKLIDSRGALLPGRDIRLRGELSPAIFVLG